MTRPSDILLAWTVEAQNVLQPAYDVDAVIRRRRAEQNLRHAAEHLTRSQRSLAAVLVQAEVTP